MGDETGSRGGNRVATEGERFAALAEGEEATLNGRPGAAAEEPHRVLVFCASSDGCDPVYHEAAAELGRVLARAGLTVVYGGGAVGSMGALADGALAEGGRVIGIQPRFMSELEWTHSRLSGLHIVDDMQERKRMMLATSDAVVALPGGSGTFEELFEAITAKRLGLYLNPIVLLNQRGFFDPCIELLERAIEERFMDARHREMWQVVESPEEVIAAMQASPAWPREALGFAAIPKSSEG